MKKINKKNIFIIILFLCILFVFVVFVLNLFVLNLLVVPTSTVPTSTVPTSTFPTSTFPTSTFPASTFPASTVPASTVPASTVPASTVTTSIVPTSTVPTSIVPTSTVPTSIVPTSTAFSTSTVPTSTASVPSPSKSPLLQPSETLPSFPWNPPAPTSLTVIPLYDMLKNLKKINKIFYYGSPIPKVEYDDLKLYHANYLLRHALSFAGYSEIRYYSVPAGFAIVTKLVRIKENGDEAGDQKDIENIYYNPIFSISDYIRSLFLAPIGRYRVIVFIVKKGGVEIEDSLITQKDAIRWLRHGGASLPEDIEERDFTRLFTCTALIYEFEKTENTGSSLKSLSHLSAKNHLTVSGVWGHLHYE